MSMYLGLAHEITDMWNVDSTIIVPIVISVNSLIAKSFNQHFENYFNTRLLDYGPHTEGSDDLHVSLTEWGHIHSHVSAVPGEPW